MASFAALEKCHTAFSAWKLKTLDERAQIIARIGEELTARNEEFAQLMTPEVGKLLSDSRDEIDLCAGICAYTAKQGRGSGR